MSQPSTHMFNERHKLKYQKTLSLPRENLLKYREQLLPPLISRAVFFRLKCNAKCTLSATCIHSFTVYNFNDRAIWRRTSVVSKCFRLTLASKCSSTYRKRRNKKDQGPQPVIQRPSLHVAQEFLLHSGRNV